MQCIVDGCERDARTRGLCENCYQLARYNVIGGKVSWEQLETMGLAIPSSRGIWGKSKFRRAFDEKIRETSNGE